MVNLFSRAILPGVEKPEKFIVTSDTMKTLIELLSDALRQGFKKNDILVLFDIDHTLLKLAPEHKEDDVRGYIGAERYFKQLLNQSLSKEEARQGMMSAYIGAYKKSVPHVVPVGDEAALKAFRYAQEHALVMMLTGRPWEIQQETEAELAAHDFELDKAVIEHEVCYARAGQDSSHDHDAVITQSGIVFTKAQCKARALEHVLQDETLRVSYDVDAEDEWTMMLYSSGRLSDSVKLVIFIDDSENHVRAVEKLCEKLNMHFMGIIYAAVQTFGHEPVAYSHSQEAA